MGKVTLTSAQAQAKLEMMNNIVELFGEDAVPSGNGKYAVQRTVIIDGKEIEIWIEIALTAKNPTPRVANKETGEMREPFCPFEAYKAWEDERAAKASEREAKAAQRAVTAKKPRAKAAK